MSVKSRAYERAQELRFYEIIIMCGVLVAAAAGILYTLYPETC